MRLARTSSQCGSLFDTQEIWRPVHYLGSKLRLTGVIADLVAEFPKGSVCDLFAGSGTVSLALSQDRDVIAADIQEYSRVICSALLCPATVTDAYVAESLRRAAASRCKLESCVAPLLEYEETAANRVESDPQSLCDLVEHGSLISGNATGQLAAARCEALERLDRSEHTAIATRYFGGLYFSFRQAAFIDSVLDQAPNDTELAALLSTASAIVSSIGKQFAQPMRPRRKDGTIKSNLIRQMCRDRRIDAAREYAAWLARYRGLRQNRPHRAVRGDYRDVLRLLGDDVSVIYADPPYTRDHYSRFYHVLETLCLKDHPSVSRTFADGPTSRGVYRADRHQSPFCIKSQAPAAFAEMFAGARGRPMVVSYSPFVKDGHPRLMTIEAVADAARSHYSSVEVVPAKLAHSKLNRRDLHLEASDRAEVFLVCR